MGFNDLTTLVIRWLHFGVLAMFVLAVSVGCGLLSVGTCSIQEQFDLSATRSARMSNQLEFSLKLVPDHVLFERDIFLVATFTNTTDRSIVFREPQQYGVIETIYPETVLQFVVEPINVDIPFNYPLEGHPDILIWPPIKRDEFITLPPHGAHESRLKLPRLVFRNGKMGDVISLPPGQYLVRMTYINDYIGYEVKRNEETRYIDVGAWVGRLESNVVSLTITSQ